MTDGVAVADMVLAAACVEMESHMAVVGVPVEMVSTEASAGVAEMEIAAASAHAARDTAVRRD